MSEAEHVCTFAYLTVSLIVISHTNVLNPRNISQPATLADAYNIIKHMSVTSVLYCIVYQ